MIDNDSFLGIATTNMCAGESKEIVLICCESCYYDFIRIVPDYCVFCLQDANPYPCNGHQTIKELLSCDYCNNEYVCQKCIDNNVPFHYIVNFVCVFCRQGADVDDEFDEYEQSIDR